MATVPFSKARERMMADPEFRKEYDALEEEFAFIEAITDAEASQNASDDPDNPPTDATFWGEAELVDPEPKKVPVCIRVRPDILKFFKQRGPGYRTRINQVLEAYVAYQEKRAGR